VISIDGLTWDDTHWLSYGLNGIAYGDGRWVMVAGVDNGGTGSNIYRAVLTSTDDGLTWSGQKFLDIYMPNGFTKIAYHNGMWVAIGKKGAISVSTDGTTWTAKYAYSSDMGFSDVAYCYDKWIVVINNYTFFYMSTDGQTWTTQTVVNSVGWNGIACNNDIGLIVLVGDNGQIATSTDNGTTWSTQTVGSNNWKRVVYGNGRWVAVGDNGQIATSTDNGTTWSTQTVGSGMWNGIAVKTD
jgi:photosystem II stability/assembly factor-like uncharacterized protein